MPPMQVPDEQKRRKILEAAARLFAERPFHKVRLDEVASAAGVGKGTLYVYFKSKDALYLNLLYAGLDQLVKRLETLVDAPALTPPAALDRAIQELVGFGFTHPHLFQLMRTVRVPVDQPEWESRRLRMSQLVEVLLRRGIETDDFHDPHPELTALYLPGMIRSVLLYSPQDQDPGTLTEHLRGFIRAALMTGTGNRSTAHD